MCVCARAAQNIVIRRVIYIYLYIHTYSYIAGLLAPVLPAVRGLGGDLQVVSIQPSAGAVTIAYKGPEKLTYGIELTLKGHPKINTVSFTALA